MPQITNRPTLPDDFDAAFFVAFRNGVGGPDDETIKEFLRLRNEGVDEDVIHSRLGSEYTTLMDAYCVFNSACVFARKQMAAPFDAALQQLQTYSSNEFVLVDGHSFSITEKRIQLAAFLADSI